jgi:hypothetical protein
MANKSSKCSNTFCQQNSVVPIYFRGEDRVFRVAFYLCKNCNECTDFFSDGKFRIPFLSKLRKETLILRLVKEKRNEVDKNTNRKKIFEIKKNKNPCFECGKIKYERIFLRDRSDYTFVGYVCKTCQVIYTISLQDFRLRKAEVLSYEDFCIPTNPEIPEEEYLGRKDVYLNKRAKKETEEITITIKIKDISRLRKLIKKHKIAISSSSDELTPWLWRSRNDS